MKTSFFFAGSVLLALVSSCDLLDSFKDAPSQSAALGEIRIHFLEDGCLKASESLTKVSALPDTNDFILSVTAADGESLFYGTFGSAPEKIIAAAGTYTVNAVSCEFSSPRFDAPQYGDSQTVVVREGEVSGVTLECAQTNAGVRVIVNSDFLEEYPGACLFLKSADGKLMYSYTEKRIAYFRPGTVSLVLNDNSKDKTLCSRTLSAQQMLTLKVNTGSSSGTSGAGVHIQLDTSRVWESEEINLGGNDPGAGKDKGNALSVYQVKDHVGESDVWVYGYIVGGDLSSSKCSFEPPFSSRTNIVLAAKSSCTDKESCVSVQLSSGKIRDALNLVDHEELLGRKVFIKGDIVSSYYGIIGIQSIVEYSF